MKLKFLRAIFWLWMSSRGYYVWSKLWRFLLERRYRGTPLTQYAHMGQLEGALGGMRWTQDPVKGRFDVISSPEKVEAIYRVAAGDREKATVGDCDEFAQYAADRLADMRQRGKFRGEIFFMTVNWLDHDGGFHGHNICAFYDDHEKTWGHIGNWFGGQAQRGFPTLEAVGSWWAEQARGELIGWAIATPDLKFLRVQLG